MDPVLTGSGYVIVLKPGMDVWLGGMCVCVCVDVKAAPPPPKKKQKLFVLSVEGTAGLRHRGTEGYCN